MRIIPALIGIFYCGFLFSQTLKPEDVYKNIKDYYEKNSASIEVAERVFKSPLGYDTVRSRIAYIKTEKEIVMLADLDSSLFITGGVYNNNGYYSVRNGVPEKFKHKKSDLPGTIFDKLNRFPSYGSENPENTFGKIKLLQKTKKEYRAVTTKYILTIDTLTFRITSLFEMLFWEGKVQTDLYLFKALSDSSKKYIKDQAEMLVNAASGFPVKTYKDLYRERAPVSGHEGKIFAFKNLVSFNHGRIDSSLKNKYIILDFFYQSCLPCHKMTEFILEWLPAVDSSKILLVGIDPFDSEKAMQLFAQERKINYPVIIGKQAKEVAGYYGIHSYPTLFFISPDGTILNIHVGVSKNFLSQAEKIISE